MWYSLREMQLYVRGGGSIEKKVKCEGKKQIAQINIINVAMAGWLHSGGQEPIPARGKQGL